MSRIDFPTYGDIHTSYDEQGNPTSWKKIRNSWVKQFDYSLESPGDRPGVEFCKKDQVWSEIVYPIDTDIDPATPGTFGRTNAGWVELLPAMGPEAPAADGLLYAVRDGAWALVPGDDLSENYYTKIESDARFASIVHTHALVDITDSGAMAAEPDAGAVDDGIQYVRLNQAWEPIALPTIPRHIKSISIIDPLDTDDALIFWTPSEITLETIKAVVLGPKGGTSGGISLNILYANTADGSGGNIGQVFTPDVLVDSSTGVTLTPQNNVIPADSYVWVNVIKVLDPNTTMLHLSLVYT